MHRSGTSMVAKVLAQAGLYLGGEADLMPPAEQNPEGFFEHLGFVRLNDEVLNAVGSGWDCPPPADVDWDVERLDGFRERARALAEPLRGHGHWGWKDPRGSLTTPFWRSALGAFRTVVVIRNPLEVVTSLHRRDGFSIALSLTLWRIYAERVLADTTPAERLVTHFDSYFVEPEREIARLLDLVGLEREQGVAALRTAAVPELRHHRKSLRDMEEAGFPSEVIALYRQLSSEAGWWEGSAESAEGTGGPAGSERSAPAAIARGAGGVDLLRVENEALRRNNADFTVALAHREARIAELEAMLNVHEAARVEFDGRIAERDSRLEDRNQLLVRSKHTIAALEQQVASLRQQIGELTERLAESERGRTIAELHEREQRTILTSLQSVQLQRDLEIMGTLGSVLSRHAPGAPASIFHRRLVDHVRRFVNEHVPVGARTLVATYGDDAFLALGERRTQPFPRSGKGITADYTDVSDEEAVAQLEALRADGLEFLVLPSPALPWLANHPELEKYLDERFALVAGERGICMIYALGQGQGQKSA
jgi:hypothetical protein